MLKITPLAQVAPRAIYYALTVIGFCRISYIIHMVGNALHIDCKLQIDCACFWIATFFGSALQVRLLHLYTTLVGGGLFALDVGKIACIQFPENLFNALVKRL